MLGLVYLLVSLILIVVNSSWNRVIALTLVQVSPQNFLLVSNKYQRDNYWQKIVYYKLVKVTINLPSLVKIIVNIIVQHKSIFNFIVSN